MRTVFGEQVDAVFFNTKVGAEVATPIHHMFGGVIQVGRTWVLEFWRAVTRPWQAKIIAGEVVAGFLVLAAFGFERLHIKQMHVAHVRFQALRALAGVANGPGGGVDFTQDALGRRFIHAVHLLHFVVACQFLAKAKLVGKLLHDHVV